MSVVIVRHPEMSKLASQNAERVLLCHTEFQS